MESGFASKGSSWGIPGSSLPKKIDVTPKFCADIETGVKGMSVPTLCRIAKTLRLSTDYILWGRDGPEDPEALLMLFRNCSPTERAYAEQLVKTFLSAVNEIEENKNPL